MSNDRIVRRLEYFIEQGGEIKDLKNILSISGTDEEFEIELIKYNTGIKKRL